MVKHQRRSHQRGLHPNEILDDCTSDSESGESPSTPKHAGMPWAPHGVMPNHHGMPHGHTMHRAASFADFGQQMNNYNMQQQYGHRHSLSGGPHEYHGQPIHEQHPNVQMLHRTASMPQHSYYVTETGNPGVATMNTNPMAPQYQVPRQQVERIEIPFSAPGLATSIQSSPSSFSAASGRSPSTQDGFYTISQRKLRRTLSTTRLRLNNSSRWFSIPSR
jgi:metal regulatory transcription factor 1